jgi:indolepyruvate ferredoxin oxidoreductase beta subunit
VQRPLSILLCALGGEGGGVLSQWLYDTAVHAGHAAQATSIPGVAQRTGATTYYVEIAPRPGAARAVFSLNPVPGEVDLLVSSELLETVRQIGLGYASAERTTVLSSSARALTVAEKMQPADGRVDAAALLAVLQRHARAAEVLDFGALARDAGTAISAVLLGAIAACGVLPFARADYEATIRRSGKGVEASLRGFALAHDAFAARRGERARIEALLPPAPAAAAAPAEPPAAWRERFPAPLHGLLALAHARLLDYQDARYAALYADRLARVVAAERDPAHAASLEVARWLALWMAYDDIARVAQLKLRASRHRRLRSEVGARDDEIVKTYEHFKPGVPEIAGLLPRALAARLSAWDARRRARGREAWALPLRIGSHTVAGTLALRCAAALRRLRVHGSRHAAEQALIERWLGAVEKGLAEDGALGAELAACGRLIKGYGSTNERGKERLLHIVDHVAFSAQPAARRALAVRDVRVAATSDDSGAAFDARLREHQAPPRPLVAQPVRWYRRRPDAAAPAAGPRGSV